MKTKAIILAAGKGTRMKSDILKVAHHVAGRPIVSYVVDAVDAIGVDEIIMVVGHQADRVKAEMTHPKIKYVTQDKQLGTGHAVMQTADCFRSDTEERVVILAGDCPLIRPDTLKNLLDIHLETNAEGSILTTHMNPPGGYGRILRGKMGSIVGIREAKDCNEDQLAITEINTGIYAFKSTTLFENLNQITTQNAQKEYYLTDIFEILKQNGDHISDFCTDDPDQAVGINTRMDLAKINRILYQQNNDQFMKDGVTIIDPANTFIDSTVTIEPDTVIFPFTIILGRTTIGKHCEIGSHSFIRNGKISDGEKLSSHAKIDQEVYG